MSFRLGVTALGILLVGACGLRPTRSPGRHPAVLSLFDRYPIVIFGEDHGQRANGEFYIQLVRNPEFAKRAGTLVLECRNSLYQPILDRYENGEDVPFDQIAQVWRNTTQVLSWGLPSTPTLSPPCATLTTAFPPPSASACSPPIRQLIGPGPRRRRL